MPIPMMPTPSSVTSPAMQAILVVPMSRPTMISVDLALAMLAYWVLWRRRRYVVGGVEMNQARARGRCRELAHTASNLHARGTQHRCAELDRGRLVVGVRA